MPTIDMIGKVMLGDCLDHMKRMEDKSVDLVLTDPPYNAKNIGPNKREYNIGIMQLPQEEYIRFCQSWFSEVRRVAKCIVFTPGISNVCYYPQPDWIACWHKPASVSFNRFGGFNAWEPFMLYGKISKGKRLPQDYILFNTLNFTKGPEKNHPCPKPLGLMELFVDKFSKESDLIYDPFLGSGTTAVACINLKRRWIGSEISPRYCEISNERIKAAENQLTLF